MTQRMFSRIAGVIFLLIALLHALRVVSRWEAVFEGRVVPMWVSWVGVVVAGYLGYEGLRLSRLP